MAHPIETVSLTHKLKLFFGLSAPIIFIVFLARLFNDIGVRMIFPFITQFAGGLNLSVVDFSWLVFWRGIIGLAGPIFGVWADRWGRRKLMAGGLLLQSLGVLWLVFSQQWWAAWPMLIFGLAVTAFLPAQQAYISDQVSYQKRGRALAVFELSWAFTAIAVLPLVGWLIDDFGWRSPLVMVALLSLAGSFLVWRHLPPAERHTHVNLSWAEIRQLCLRPNVLAAMLAALLMLLAGTCIITIWGIWLPQDFGLSATSLGLVGTAIGVAELTASSSSSLFIDRLGKRRGTALGLLLAATGMLLLPLTREALPLAVTTLVVIGLSFEFSIVSILPLYSEQAPEARGTLFSLIFLGTAIGVSIGTPVTAMLWDSSGLWGVCAVTGACLLGALGLMWRFLQERGIS
ncbi:MAG: MFS transporter [Anaerolineae bacterium]